jgi:hypothetical protein
MKKRYTEEQIIGVLPEADAMLPVKELCRKHGFSELKSPRKPEPARGREFPQTESLHEEVQIQ